MKEMFIGTAKACLYMGTLIGVYWVLNGFKTLVPIDIVGVLAVGAILEHFVDKEEKKRTLQKIVLSGSNPSKKDTLGSRVMNR